MNNAYLVLTDLHYATEKENRKNYFSEVLNIISGVLDLNQKYREAGYNVHLLFLGDIIDGPIRKADEAMRCIELMRFFTSQFTSCYTVLGNHEENNTASNPFWFLVDNLEDDALKCIPRPLQPQSMGACIRVPSILVDGEVKLYFNHFGIPSKTPEGRGVHVGLFHQNVGSSDICKMWGTFEDVEEASYVQAYNYLFFGHMHLASGRYELNVSGTCIGEWLGTCVGTNVNEVEALAADLIVPAILVRDGRFISVERNKVPRVSPQDAIDYELLNVKKALQQTKEQTRVAGEQIAVGETLLLRIKSVANQEGLGPIVDLLEMGYNTALAQYRAGLNAVGLQPAISEESA